MCLPIKTKQAAATRNQPCVNPFSYEESYQLERTELCDRRTAICGAIAADAGGLYPNAECGRCVLYTTRHFSITKWAPESAMYSCFRASLEKAEDVRRSGRLLRICRFFEKRKGWARRKSSKKVAALELRSGTPH